MAASSGSSCTSPTSPASARPRTASATSEARFRRAIDEAPSGMALGSEDGRLLWVNDAFCALLGRPWAEVVGRLATDFVHSDDLEEAAEIMRSGHVLGNLDERPILRLMRPDGSVVWGQISLSRLTGDGPDPEANPLLLAQLVDVSAAHEAEARLAHQATHDALTGLPNRTLLLDRLAQAMHRRVRTGGEVVVLFLDLDDFKVVNDGLGHAAGDEMLVEAARRLRRCVRASDTVARLGGDEFVLVCELDRPHEVAALCDRVLGPLATPVRIAGRTLVMSGSLGVVIGDDDQEPADLLRDADVAMYRSKADGRGCSTMFDRQPAGRGRHPARAGGRPADGGRGGPARRALPAGHRRGRRHRLRRRGAGALEHPTRGLLDP